MRVETSLNSFPDWRRAADSLEKRTRLFETRPLKDFLADESMGTLRIEPGGDENKKLQQMQQKKRRECKLRTQRGRRKNR